MIENKQDTFNGIDCLWLGNEQVRLAVTTRRGPRIVAWGWRDGENLFAELPDVVIGTPPSYSLLGGHRLWYAPEMMETTYLPDDRPLEVEQSGASAMFTAPDDGAGIVKRITVEVLEGLPEVRVAHSLTNVGSAPMKLAPWGISICKIGGVAILPQPKGSTDPHSFLPNRNFSLWTYSDILDERITLGNKATLVLAAPGANNKIGYFNMNGWIGYWTGDTLYTKRFTPQPHSEHPDMGCNAEVYFAEEVIELETLGPMTTLEPGSEITHEEIWRLDRVKAQPASITEQQAVQLAGELGLM